MTGAPEVNRHQILALTGGGYRGVFTAAFLAHCEKKWSAPCSERFDLFAGTSVGALLAAGLAAGRSAQALVDAMKTHGPKIFPARPLKEVQRMVASAPYATEPLKAAIEDVLGEQKNVLLSDFAGKLVVPAVNYSKGTADLFVSKGLAGSKGSKVKLVDAVLASAAAPTYFPMIKIGRFEYADGGLVANAPDMVALIEAMTRQHADLEHSYMLSLGTANWSKGVALRDTPDNPIAFKSIIARGLVQTTLRAQEDLAQRQIKVLLGERHLRVDREPDAERVNEIRDLDYARPEAFAALLHVADEAWAECERREDLHELRLRNFFSR